MKKVLARYADRARVEPLHREFALPDRDGTSRTVQDWFSGPLEDVMAALARSEWVTPGSVPGSKFFTDVVGPAGLMAGIIARPDVEVIERWVAGGCPPPGGGGQPAKAQAVTSLAAATDVPFTRKRLAIGMGSVH